jgi:hypothetical protein
MAAITKIQDFTEQLGKGLHQIGTHTFKLALCSAAPAATNTQLSDLTQIAYTNISGGVAPTVTLTISEAAGTTTVGGDEVVVTATGTVPTFRYYALYNDSATNKNLVCFWDHGSNVDLANSGDTFTVKFNNDSTAGTIFTLA